MTLPEYLLRKNERPIAWLFVRSWIPARTERYSWLRVAAFTVKSAAIGAGLLAIIAGLIDIISRAFTENSSPPGMTFIWTFLLPMTAEFAACIGLCWGVVSRICWNQRAARLAASPESPDATAPWPRLGFFRRIGWRLLYRLVVGLLTPMLLFHAVENTRATWAWRQLRAELAAKGECYELRCIIPPPARDEENFFATPFWKQFEYQSIGGMTERSSVRWEQQPPFPYSTNFVLPADPRSESRTAGVAKEPSDGRIDLGAWAARLREVTTNAPNAKKGTTPLTFPLPATPGTPAADVLFAFTKFDATLAEFAAAAPRPRSRYPVHYEEGFNALIPNLAAMKSSTHICALRAVARLAAGDKAGAAADTMLAFRLGEAMAEEPLLVSQLVRFACDSISMRALWHGLADHRWDDAQLAKFQDLLGRRDYAGGMLRALEGERAIGNETAEYLVRRRGGGLAELDKMGSGIPSENTPALTFADPFPSGWYRQNQIGFLTGWQEILEHDRQFMNRTNRAVTLHKDSHIDVVTDDIVTRVKANPSPFKILVGMLLPGISKATGKANCMQATAGMAVVACALERHRLSHGAFPASLAELVPAYLPALPADWMGGQPLHYQRTDDGWFRLWSIGPDGKDDGGVYRALRADGRGVGDDLDWVWPLPLPTREPRLF